MKADLKQLVRTIGLAILLALCLFPLMWSVLMMSWYFIFVFVGLAAFSLFLLMQIQLHKWIIITYFLCILFFSVIGFSFGLDQVQQRFTTMHEKYVIQGVDGLNLFDRMTIYETNMMMAAYAMIIGWPEISIETFLMYFPGDRIRTRRSDFAMADPLVREIVDVWIEQASIVDDGYRFAEEYLAWDTYTLSNSRVALALNGAWMHGEIATGEDGDRFLHCQIHIACDYPDSSFTRMVVPVLNKPLQFEEGLYHALEEIGWLHTYTMIWEWEVEV